MDLKAKGLQKQYIPVSIPAPETQWQLFFDDVDLGPEDVVGEIDKGFSILFKSLNPERILVGSICCGLGRYALNRAVDYVKERKVFNNVPIGAYQGLQHPLASARTDVEMASLMTLKAAWIFDQGREAGEFANMAKLAAADAGIKAVDTARAVPWRQRLHQGIRHLRPLSAGASVEDRAAQSRNDPQLHRRACDGLAAQLLGYRAMAMMKSDVSTASDEYRRNRQAYDARIADLHARRAAAALGGPERARQLHKERKQLLPRERIAALIDPGSPFLEFCQLAGEGMYDGVPPGGSIITGVGMVSGRACMIIANDATVKGGTYYGITCKKHVRAQRFAWQHRLPCVTLGAIRRRQPAGSAQHLPRRRPVRLDLLQPDPDVERRHSADRRRSRALDGGRRLYAGAVRRDRHRAQSRRDVPGRAAARLRRDTGKKSAWKRSAAARCIAASAA